MLVVALDYHPTIVHERAQAARPARSCGIADENSRAARPWQSLFPGFFKRAGCADAATTHNRVDYWVDLLANSMKDNTETERILKIPAIKTYHRSRNSQYPPGEMGLSLIALLVFFCFTNPACSWKQQCGV